MNKKILLTAFAVFSFSLFSFKTPSDIKITRNSENPNLFDVEYAKDSFTSSVETFPDNFVRMRETWTKIDPPKMLEAFTATMNEIDEALKNL